MKNIVILTLGLVFAQVSFAAEKSTYVKTSNPETAQSIFALPQDDCGGGDEDWDCETEVESRSGTIDVSRCGSNRGGSWACYEDIEETCRERRSGRTSTRSYRRFTGACAESLSDCW